MLKSLIESSPFPSKGWRGKEATKTTLSVFGFGEILQVTFLRPNSLDCTPLKPLGYFEPRIPSRNPSRQEMKTREREREREREYLKAKAFNMRVGRNSLLLGGRLHLLDLHLVQHARSRSLSLSLSRVLSLSLSPSRVLSLNRLAGTDTCVHTEKQTNKRNRARPKPYYENGMWTARCDHNLACEPHD
jgi:hypothetical protein